MRLTDRAQATPAARAEAAGIDLTAERAVVSDRLNWLRAGVLGANDGIVSTAALILGVAGASLSFDALLTAGVAGLAAGALSMAAGEYVSVSAQRDTEKAAVHSERTTLSEFPEAELAELTALLQARGLSAETARDAARELTHHNALAAHAHMELGIELGKYSDPLHAAMASALAFAIGALVPLIAALFSPLDMAVPMTVGAVFVALTVTGSLAAYLGGAPRVPAIVRNVIGGGLAMAVTYGIGLLVGTQL
ncbi:MAG: VIT family protein [Burkholderiales bacterium]|nr:VIT family protein [Burkholderiales bacterium]